MKIEITKRAEKQLEKLDESIRDRIYKELFKFRDKAHNITVKKRKSKTGQITLRAGNYRISIKVHKKNRIFEVCNVKHRREAFRD